jgi:hypothetical protein
MRTVTRLLAFGLPIAAILGEWLPRSEQATGTVAIRPTIEVTGATPEHLSLARWAVGRFEMAGLEPPALEIVFHADTSRCEGHMGWARSGRVDICTVLANEMSRRNLLHEMSHIWLDQNVGARTRDRFLHVRGLSYWNSSGDPWELRGFEQGAELMAWTLGNRILSAQIPDNAPSQLAAGFKLLTRVEIASSNPLGFCGYALPTALLRWVVAFLRGIGRQWRESTNEITNEIESTPAIW